jgi:hypothetical protein
MSRHTCILKDPAFLSESCTLPANTLNLDSAQDRDLECQNAVYNKEDYAKLYNVQNNEITSNVKHKKCCPTSLKGKPVSGNHPLHGSQVVYNSTGNKLGVIKEKTNDKCNKLMKNNDISSGWSNTCNEFDQYYACKTDNTENYISNIHNDKFYLYNIGENNQDCNLNCSDKPNNYNKECCNKSLKNESAYGGFILYDNDEKPTQAIYAASDNEKDAKFGRSTVDYHTTTKYDACLLASAKNVKMGKNYRQKYYKNFQKNTDCSCPQHLKNILVGTSSYKPNVVYNDNYSSGKRCLWSKDWCDTNGKPTSNSRTGDKSKYQRMTEYDQCILNSGNTVKDWSGTTSFDNFSKVYNESIEGFVGDATLSNLNDISDTDATATRDAYGKCVDRVKQDRVQIQVQQAKINNVTDRALLLHNKEINDLNNELSKVTHNISKFNNNYTMKNKLALYMSIAIFMLIVLQVFIKIGLSYKSRASSNISKISNISPKLNNYNFNNNLNR